MKLLCAALLAAVLVLAGKLSAVRREQKHMLRQLQALEQGSRIELTSVTGNRDFLRMYRKLNQIFTAYRQQEAEYLRSEKQQKQTISSIAHDIRTPLTGAMGYLQILEETAEEEARSRYCRLIGKRLEELKRMLEELFLYTKLTSPEFTLECSSIPVFPALSQCMIGRYQAFEEMGIEPEVSFQQEEITVWANTEALERVFGNLIQNALLHGTGGLRVQQKGLRITFYNTIDPAQQMDTACLFERFYKADQTRKKGSSGLGLAIVKELMERMGGTVSARLQGDELGIILEFCGTGTVMRHIS